MNLHKRATRLVGGALPHALRLFLLTVVGILLPNMALAAEANVKLRLAQSDKNYLYASLLFGLIALAYGFYLRASVLRQSPGDEKMQEVGQAIKDGAKAYLSQQVKTMIIFVALLFVGLIFLFKDFGYATSTWIAVSFVLGVAASYIAGYTGMMTAVSGNMRTANAALTSYKRSLEVAFRSGAVAGMVTVGMGLLGATLILLLAGENAMRLLVGFGFGGSLAALFMRVGGGIFTKAADVGADLVGKVEAGIPEDDPRNPATIADNVGDNVGDCAGMAADIFESYEVTLVAAIVLGAATAAVFDQATWTRLVLFALMARGIGIIASMFGIATVRGSDDLDADPLKPIRSGFYRSAAVAAIATAILAYLMMGGPNSPSAPVRTNQLTPVAKFQQDEARLVAGLRQTIASSAGSKIDEAKQLIEKVARDKKKAPTAVTLEDLRGPDGKLIEEARGIPGAAIQRAISGGDAASKPILPYEVTASDIVNSEEMRERGYTPDDEAAVQQALAMADQPTPALPNLSGFQEVTNPDDPNFPALRYGTNANTPLQGETAPNDPFQTVGSKYTGQGDSRFVVAQVKIVADLPAVPGQGGMPARPAQKIDRTEWVGPIREKALKQQIDQQREFAQQQNIKATLDIVKSVPVKLFAGPDNKLALAVEDDIAKPQQLRPTEPLTYYAADVATLKDLANPQGAGMAPAIPPQQQMQLAVVSRHTVPWWTFFAAILFGLVMAFLIELLTDYYVSTHKRPVQEVAGVSTAGPAPMIIQGFAYAMESSVFMVFSIVIALLFPLFLFNPAQYGGYILSFYGIALVGLGLLTTTG
ncbi:MAG TPA: sodium/proton-translocating pyrophosphatase, partial [Fimbriimonas sp.]